MYCCKITIFFYTVIISIDSVLFAFFFIVPKSDWISGKYQISDSKNYFPGYSNEYRIPNVTFFSNIRYPVSGNFIDASYLLDAYSNKSIVTCQFTSSYYNMPIHVFIEYDANSHFRTIRWQFMIPSNMIKC